MKGIDCNLTGLALCASFAVLSCCVTPLLAHDIHGDDEEHPHYDLSVKPPLGGPSLSLAGQLAQMPQVPMGLRPNDAPVLASMFAPFAPKVRVRWDEHFLYIESDGMPLHRMMLGITAWQQQVPLPQAYSGENAWCVPLLPVTARIPLSAKTDFFRGAIAIAANGVPIFNPIKNDGHTDTFLAGELDEYGGHAGRADDYHYHIAPLHLQSQVGKGKPIAIALDGYPIYGLTEPDGSTPHDLDAFDGHTTPALGYHYHASKTYPYVNGGFHGEVTRLGGQVDPQPRAFGVRPALPPLPGATITGFTQSPDGQHFDVQYSLGGKTGHVRYALEANGVYTFQYVNTDGTTTEQTYNGDAPGNDQVPPPRNDGNRPSGPRGGPNPNDPNRKPWIVDHLQEMDANGDGTLTREELMVEVTTTFSGYDRDKNRAISEAERDAPGGVHSAMGGFVKAHWREVDADGSGQVTLDELTGVALRMFGKSDRNNDNRLTPEELNVAAAPRNDGNGRPPNPNGSNRPDNNRPDNNRPTSPPRGAVASNGVVKPTMADTIAGHVYADNWFALYINGKLRVIDPIEFLPHNVVSVDILPEYPMTLAVIAHDNADPKTGLEYGDHIGDGGFILKFADGTVTDATWKAKAIERGPLNGDIKNPHVQIEAIPASWFAPDFDDSSWANARVWSEQQVNPKAPFYEHDFAQAQFIWSEDLSLDNTVLFRKRIEKLNWKPSWNAHPDGPLPGEFGR